jgi:hypothetical protein
MDVKPSAGTGVLRPLAVATPPTVMGFVPAPTPHTRRFLPRMPCTCDACRLSLTSQRYADGPNVGTSTLTSAIVRLDE